MQKFILDPAYKRVKKLAAIQKCKERLENDNYISSTAKAMDEEFVRNHEDYIFVIDWCNEHHNEFTEVPARSDSTKREHIMEIKIPYFDSKLNKYIPANGELRMWFCSSTHHHPYFSLKHKCHWDEIDRFLGERIDWQPTLCKEILLNQDKIEEWCEELTLSYLNTQLYWK